MLHFTFKILKKVTAILPRSADGQEWLWVHCNRKFTGYYETDYTFENWESLGTALRLKNNVDTKYPVHAAVVFRRTSTESSVAMRKILQNISCLLERMAVSKLFLRCAQDNTKHSVQGFLAK